MDRLPRASDEDYLRYVAPPAPPLDEQSLRGRLGALAYSVLFRHGTEPPAYVYKPTDAEFACAACGQLLFGGRDAFNSGTGWPSFKRPLDARLVGTTEDRSLGSVRTEVHCSRCRGHLGHVFPDGPGPLGLRFCINGVSLKKTGDGDAAKDADP